MHRLALFALLCQTPSLSRSFITPFILAVGILLGAGLSSPVLSAEPISQGFYHQIDITEKTSGHSSYPHMRENSLPIGPNLELGGVPFIWTNKQYSLFYPPDSRYIDTDFVTYTLDQPLLATHVYLLAGMLAAANWESQFGGQDLAHVEVSYEEGGTGIMRLTPGVNIRNHLDRPDYYSAQLPDNPNICEVARGVTAPYGEMNDKTDPYYMDRIKLPLPSEDVKARKRIRQITIRQVRKTTNDVFGGYLLFWGLTLSRERPLIVVPGIMGTEIGSGVASPWPWGLLSTSPDEMASLGFTPDGAPYNPGLKPLRLLGQDGSHIGDLNAYGGLIKFLQQEMGYKIAKTEPTPGGLEQWTQPPATIDRPAAAACPPREDLYTLPYDWRRSTQEGAERLKLLVARIKERTGADKVDLVAHSMGGLVSRLYLSQGGAADVDTYISLGTPYYGAPKALRILRFGEKMTPNSEGSQRVGFKRAVRNMWGPYALLPSAAYVAKAGPYYTYNGRDVKDRFGQPLTGPMSFAQVSEWIQQAHCGTDYAFPVGCAAPDEKLYNAGLVDWATTLHAQIDGWDATGPDAPVKYAIIGSGLLTPGPILENAFGRRQDGTYQRRVTRVSAVSGDGTVPTVSAEGAPPSAKRYYAPVEHAAMPNSLTVEKQVQNLLRGIEDAVSGVGTSAMSASGFALEVYSPVQVEVFDAAGNRTGVRENGTEQNDIPGSRFEWTGDMMDDKVVLLTGAGPYTVKLRGLAEGKATVAIQEIREDAPGKRLEYRDVSVTEGTRAEVVIPAEVQTGMEAPSLKVDENGDGGVDQTLLPVDGNAPMKGDVDGDKHVSVLDAVLVLRSITGSELLSPAQAGAADVNGDDGVDVRDAVTILRIVVGLEG